MAEALEGGFRLDMARDDGDQQRREGDEIIADLVPDEEDEGHAEQAEEEHLVAGHGSPAFFARSLS